MKLNLGCGSQKLEGYIGIDVEESCKPDVICNFLTQPLPYEENSVEQVVMFHTIEHIRKRYHKFILGECRRVLQVGGRLILSYPDFWTCAQNWHTNYKGQKDFWEATLFGLQQYPSDFHVCAMDPPALELLLVGLGFEGVRTMPEKFEPHNMITNGAKIATSQVLDYEAQVGADRIPCFLQKVGR